MKRIFGSSSASSKVPPPSLSDATDRLGNRGDTLDAKTAKLDAQLVKYRQQIKACRPGPAQEGLKRRAMNVLRQKRMYEGQRDQLMNQQFNLEQAAFTTESMQDSVDTVRAMKGATTQLKSLMGKNKELDINNIDKLNDDMADLNYLNEEIQEAIGRSYDIPDDVDESDLMDELDALDAELAEEGVATTEEGVPSYLADLPDVPEGQLAAGEDELPAVPMRE